MQIDPLIMYLYQKENNVIEKTAIVVVYRMDEEMIGFFNKKMPSFENTLEDKKFDLWAYRKDSMLHKVKYDDNKNVVIWNCETKDFIKLIE
jgi:hypothetical protein